MSFSTLLIFSCTSIKESDSFLDGDGESGGLPSHENRGLLLYLASIRRVERSILLSASLSLLFSREGKGW